MKIAILGTENSHAYAFSKLIKENPKYAGIEVIGVYGYDAAANQKLLDDKLVPHVASRPDEYVDQVDAIMVTARHGDLHHEYAMPYVKKGIPAFIDKPFCVDMGKVDELMDAAKASGAKLCGGSSLKFMDEIKSLRRYADRNKLLGGYLYAPINMVNEYGGFYFYAQHLMEMLITTFGSDVKSVYAYCPDTQKNRLSVIFHYDNYDVTAQYGDCYHYGAAVVCDAGIRQAVCEDPVYCYEHELDDFVHMVRSDKMDYSFDALRKPVELLHAIEKSYLEKVEVQL